MTVHRITDGQACEAFLLVNVQACAGVPNRPARIGCARIHFGRLCHCRRRVAQAGAGAGQV